MTVNKRPRRPSGSRVLADCAGSVALLWSEREPPSRGPKPALSVEAIARAAIAIADAEGLATVSMQRVAREFGVTPMALYRYVPGKAELVDLMIDTGLAGPPAPLDGDWRARLTAWARLLFAAFRRHPWALAATGSLRVMGPNELAWMEAALRALADTGLSPAEAHQAFLAVVGHVRILAQFSLAAGTGPRHLTRDQWAAATRELLRDHADRFPALAAALAAEPGPDDPLESGLATVLDGVAARIARRSGT